MSYGFTLSKQLSNFRRLAYYHGRTSDRNHPSMGGHIRQSGGRNPSDEDGEGT